MDVITNAICTFCGCTCDDIELHVEAERIVKVRHACCLGESWFLNHHAGSDDPPAFVEGRPASLEEAVAAAADFLVQADYPLIYGLSNTTCEAQREAVTLAEWLGGAIDSHSSL